jgi:hypothetical protein
LRFLPLRRTGILVGALVALALPGFAHAGSGPTITSGHGSAVVDGVIDSQWANARTYPLTVGSTTGTVYVMNDASNLYIGFTIQDINGTCECKNFFVSFDNNHNSELDVGEDRWENYELAPAGADRFWTGATWLADDRNDLFTRRTYNDSHQLTIEMVRPFYTDDSHDVWLQFGSVYGIVFSYGTNGFPFNNFPAGANTETPSTYANLSLTDNILPVVDAASFVPGTFATVSGTTTLSARATDNIGVTRVDFVTRPDSSTAPTVVASVTDHDAAGTFTAEYDTTGLPDGAGRCIGAVAYDAAGNFSLGYTNCTVTVANAPSDETPPVVSVTEPTAGSVLHGIVNVSATASDDASGVDRVEFSVFDGTSNAEAPIGTDSDPPYTATFDSTLFVNTIPLDATVYATAYDAAGNRTKVGVGVTLENGRIAFESDREGSNGLDIYSSAPDGSDLLRLTSSPGDEVRAALSPDGQYVAYQKYVGDYVQIFTVRTNGDSAPVQLTFGESNNEGPQFSPNGRSIAFASNRSGNWDIYRVAAAGGTPLRITFDAADDVSPSWSPDGLRIAFDSTRGEGGDRNIWTINAKGSGTVENPPLVQLTSNIALDSDPAWSPDGTTIAFASSRGNNQMQVYTMSSTLGDSPLGTVTPITLGPEYSADPAWSPDGQHLTFARANGFTISFEVWVADADGGNQRDVTDTGGRNAFPSWGGAAPVAGGATSADISISGPETSRPGAAAARLSDIPLDAVRGAVESSSQSAAPLGGIPLGGIPLGGIPLGGIPLGGIPLGGIGGVGWSPSELQQNGLGGVPLSSIPLKAPDRWEAHLAGTAFAGTPTQNVTLAQILNTPAAHGVTLSQLDLSSSPLGGIPLGGIALGGLPLGGIPLGGIATSTANQNLADWCAYINQQNGFSCASASTLADATMVGLALRGVPLGGIPLGGIPLGGIPLGGIPLGGIAVGSSQTTQGLPLGGIPLGGIDLAGTPLGGIPLGGIDMSKSPLGGIPLGGIPLGGIALKARTDLFNCPTGAFLCLATDTLAGAAAAGALKPGVTIADLGYYLNADGTPITISQLVQGLPPGTSLADLLGTILAKSAYDWETLPLTTFPLQDFAGSGAPVSTYNVHFTLNGDGGSAPADVTVRIPDGARFVGDSSLVTLGDTTAVPAGDPTPGPAANELVWHLEDVPVGTQSTLSFKARPGLVLGTEIAGAKLASPELETAVAEPAQTVLTQNFGGNGDPNSEFVPTILPNTLYVGYTPNGADRDYFKILAPPPGTQRIFHLSHLHVDDDLVVFGAAPAPLRLPKATSVPVGSAQLPDIPFTLGQRSQQITPEPLTDVPQNVGTVLGVSDNRGLDDEEVTLNTPEDTTGFQTIQISSFDGGHSDEPWILRVEDIPAIPLPTACTKPPLTGGPGGAGAAHAIPAVPATASTLYLFNSKRFGDLYGLTAENAVWSRLQTMAARTDAAGGAVIPVEGDAGVSGAYSAWDSSLSNYCSPGRANDVTRAIGKLLDGITTSTVKFVVIVGDDAVIPYGRVLDNTSYANERGYTTTFLDSINAKNNEYMSAYGLGFLPTDDPYGDTNYTGSGPYVPELAVGRLVEQPAQITAQLDQYVTRNGAIAPTSSLTTGYDFLKDGATAVSNALKPTVGAANARELISDGWSRDNLVAAMFPATNAPVIDSINAHYDHNRTLPADENAAQRESILFTTDTVASRGPNAVAGRIIFTMGCHSALNVHDFVVSSSLAPDWAQTYAAGGAIVYMGNLGYGLGDTVAVAYSEKLNQLFAQRLDGTVTVGEALMYAKQEYAAVPIVSGYDLKVINEAELSGLPMYRVGTATTPAPPLALPLATDATTGLPTSTFNITPTFTRVDVSTGSYYTSDGGASFENRRPIQPLSTVDVTEPGLVAHGVIITKAVSTDEPAFDAAFSRVAEDLSAFSPELVGDAVYPTKLQALASVSTPNGVRQRAILFGGQYRNDAVNDAQGIGTQRRFTTLAGSVLYAQPTETDFAPASFGPVAVTKAGSTVGFAVDVTDYSAAHAALAADRIKRVLALYKDASGAWRSTELSRLGTTYRWSGGGSVSGDEVEWFIQAVDASGNVAVTSNKADVRTITQPPATGTTTASVAGPLHASGWYTGPVTVTITAAPGVSVTRSVDGAPFVPYTAPFDVTGSGVHTLAFAGSDGSSGTTSIPIDVTPPTITFASPGILTLGQTANYDFFTCGDAGSGVSACDVSGIDTSTVTAGTTTRTASVHAVDRVGNTYNATGTYRVVWPFRGFLPFVRNPPFVNRRIAGQIVFLRFALGGNRGTSVLAAGYPKSTQITCAPAIPEIDGTDDQTTYQPGLIYIRLIDQYIYVWKTDAAWKGTCRQFTLRLADGTDHVANFKFR